MGADMYETPEELQQNRDDGIPDIGIGENTAIRSAIIDTNARIGSDCSIGFPDSGRKDGTYGSYSVRDGITIIPKNAVIPNGTVI